MTSGRAPTGSEAQDRIGIAKEIFDACSTMALAMIADGAPWAAKVFFVEDEPEPGCLDLCCVLVMTPRNRSMLEKDARVAFVVGGEVADRWLQGSGRAIAVDDDADAAAVLKRLEEKAPAAGPFLRQTEAAAVRIHVDRLRLTDMSADPPVAEFTFAAD